MRLDSTSRALLALTASAAVLTPAPGRDGAALGLALGIVSPAPFGATLGPSGTVDTIGGTVNVVNLGRWTLRVTGSDAGRLRRVCAQGTTVLTNPLRVFATGAIVDNVYGSTSANPMALSASPQPVASGNGLGVLAPVVLTYRYTPSASDQLAPACAYSQTTTIELIAP